ncbi:MAG: thioredoxin domain-containing protein [bacterium]|nr:thioredoxin domain-containing protein [bacterium]
MTRQRWFLIGAVAIGTLTLWSLRPPYIPKQTPSAISPTRTFDIRHSTFDIPTILPTDPVRGLQDTPLTIIEFGDFTCPSCIDAEAMLTELRNQYGPQLRIVWKDFPVLDRLTNSRRTHIAARCAQRQQRFWEYHDAVLAEQPRDDSARATIAGQLGLDAVSFASCLEQEQTAALVDAGTVEAEQLQLRSAPTFSVNGEWLEAHPTVDDFRDILDRALR